MATSRTDSQRAEQEKPDRSSPAVNAAIAENVMLALGQPGDLLRVQVKHLWRDHYRVNVLVGKDATLTRVAHSYFLEADGNGAIVGSTPKIARVY